MFTTPSAAPVPRPHQVVIVDHDPMIVDLIKYNLENEGYAVSVCADADEALECDFSVTDMVITEVLLKDINGLMLASMLKANPLTASIPVIFCTTLDSEDDIVKGFDAGADDYILKPFSLRELMARIKAVLRRRGMGAPHKEGGSPAESARPVTYGGLSVDPGMRTVSVDNREVALTRTEMQLLHTLIAHPDKVYTHAELYELVWQKQPEGSSRALDVTVSRLRKKLGPYASCIVNRSGVGYAFNPANTPAK